MKQPVASSTLLAIASIFLVASCVYQQPSMAPERQGAEQDETSWQDEFDLSGRTLVPTGRNSYFVLEPGFQIVLEGGNEKVTITVLDETVKVDGATTRVVEEREWKHGELVEVSRNLLAIDDQTKDLFYFGEEVDDYSAGKVVGHGGAWQAGRGDARPGMLMPGQPYVGQKYYQEIAPGVAMDRALIVSLEETQKTPVGTFAGCMKTQETTPLNPLEKGFKTYAPGIGLIQDENLLLTKYGFIGN